MAMLQRVPFMVVACVIAMQFIWALGLAIDPSSQNATAVFALMAIARDPIAVSHILIISTLLATVGFLSSNFIIKVLFLIPQQVLLTISAVGCFNAMYNSAFADGVERTRWFIILDQSPVMLFWIGHTIVLVILAAYPDNDHHASVA